MNFGTVTFSAIIFLLSALAQASTVFMFGGGSRPQVALQKFVEQAQGQILVITWATGEPEASFAALQSDLIKAGAQQILPSIHEFKSIQDRQDFIEDLKNSKAVFFTGGDQNVALDVIDQQNLRAELQAAYESGKVFAGTSAGTALIPKLAMRGGDPHSLPQTRLGLGLLDYFVDQHFIVRDREPRLRKLVEQGQKWGVGVDEGMCAMVEGQKLTALGPTEVQIFIPKTNGTIDKVRLQNEAHIVMPTR